jgi:hypothetical protein
MCPPGQAPRLGALISLLKRGAQAVSSGFETAVSFCVAGSPSPRRSAFLISRRPAGVSDGVMCQVCRLQTDGAQSCVSDRARRRAEEDGADTLFVGERRRSRRPPKRDPRPPQICRRSRRTRRKRSRFSDTIDSSDPMKTAAPRRTSQRAQRAIRNSERSEPSNTVPPMGFEPMLERV